VQGQRPAAVVYDTEPEIHVNISLISKSTLLLQRIESRKAPKIDVADLMGAFTSAFEVRGKWDIEPKYFTYVQT
jgi:hypothetical protein